MTQHPGSPVYLDYNATTPVDSTVLEAMLPYLRDSFGNPSSAHVFGAEARRAVEAARADTAALLGARPEEIVFTGGGTESDNLALEGVARAGGRAGGHIVASSVEHPAVLEALRALERHGFATTLLAVDAYGMVDPGELERVLRHDTFLLSVMHANNEVGTIQPLRELARIAHRHGIVVHTDAAQSVGKIPVDVGELGVDLLTVAGHKLYAPKGVGALYIRSGLRLERIVHGAGHERGLRPGTENVPYIVGLGAACRLAASTMGERSGRAARLRDRLQELLLATVPGMRVNGHPEFRLPNTLSVGFRGIDAGTLLASLPELAASAGAACHADSVTVSPTLAAMGVPVEYAMGTVRFSTGAGLSRADVERAAALVRDAVERLRPDAHAAQAKADSGEVRLTRFTHGLGCACKIGPRILAGILADLPVPTDPDVLVGVETSDDAAVYRLDGVRGIVQTVDFFTPIVDDPYHFGAIAAANALSDIYAMGGTPLFALNIVCFPTARLPIDVLRTILRGASDKAAEAGIPILGGHSVDDIEPKFGMCVTGRIDPDRILTNAKARPGDALVLTKPLGLGIVSTALKRGVAPESAVARATAVMERLNRRAAELMARFDASAATDVTGFGFLGHLRGMCRASGVDMVVRSGEVPVLEEAAALAAAGMLSGGGRENEALVGDTVLWDDGVPDILRAILCDPQTSGGLLVAIARDHAQAFVEGLRAADCPEAAVVGFVAGPSAGSPETDAAKGESVASGTDQGPRIRVLPP